MEHQRVKMGKIPKRICQLFSLSEDVVWAPNAFLDELASHYPGDYLRKVEEAAHILKEPQYGAYDAKRKKLYLVREYVKGAFFCKVYVAIDCLKEKHWIEIGVLTPQKAAELLSEAGINWQVIPLAKRACVGTSPKKGNSRKSMKKQSPSRANKS